MIVGKHHLLWNNLLLVLLDPPPPHHRETRLSLIPLLFLLPGVAYLNFNELFTFFQQMAESRSESPSPWGGLELQAMKWGVTIKHIHVVKYLQDDEAASSLRMRFLDSRLFKTSFLLFSVPSYLTQEQITDFVEAHEFTTCCTHGS